MAIKVVDENVIPLRAGHGNLSVECFSMSGHEDVSLESARRQLADKLHRVSEQLRREMSARGFDPAQAEHLALTGPLAKLYMEREELREELNTMSDEEYLTVERDVS